MEDAIIRRHLSSVRALVLDIVDTEDAPDRDRIAAAWQRRRPCISGSHAQRLPYMSDKCCGS